MPGLFDYLFPNRRKKTDDHSLNLKELELTNNKPYQSSKSLSISTPSSPDSMADPSPLQFDDPSSPTRSKPF